MKKYLTTNLSFQGGFLITKTKKLILGLSSLVVVAYGTYNTFSNKEPSKYSIKWINNLTNKEWEKEREIIRQKFCNPKYDEATRLKYQNILRIFDKVKSDRDWAGRKPQGPAYHREHGYNLYKP